ncbi:MAG: hypothetical protein ACK5ME_05730 [Parahaliea sp.]
MSLENALWTMLQMLCVVELLYRVGDINDRHSNDHGRYRACHR